MTKRRITLVVDEDQWWGESFGRTMHDHGERPGLTVEAVEAVEDVPEPIVQTFTVTARPGAGFAPLSQQSLQISLERRYGDSHAFTVTEVTEPPPVEFARPVYDHNSRCICSRCLA